ncbi:MAG TPA: AtpZ/AtpI family protein [Minicystis sp.]|nr:AtpZ/AtpI family protein [Minicystis sp.]
MTRPVGGPSERMRESVERLEARRGRWAREAGHTLGAAVEVIGIGWLVVTPAVLGFAAGHWLDGRFGAGVVFGAALGFAGLVVGCWAAWKRIAGARRPDPR